MSFVFRVPLTIVAVLSLSSMAQALSFNLLDFGNIQTSNPLAYNGVVQAAARWSSLFTDNVVVNLQIDFFALSAGNLASTNSIRANYDYTTVRSALATDRLSSDDFTAVTNLPNASGGTAFNVMINYTSNNPNGAGSSTSYLDNNSDANNTTIRVTNSNAKALGLLAANNSATDAFLRISDSSVFDFDPSDGVTAGAYDFVGVMVHEIGHALGFVSGIDTLDANSNGTVADSQFTFVSTLDLYRRSAASLANGGGDTLDWSAGSNAYFSLNGGATNLALFSTGRTRGDGEQASHWKDNQGIGILDPTFAQGELAAISGRDIQALDVIGWNLASSVSAPEPGTLVLALLSLPACIVLRRRRAQWQNR